MKIAKARRDKLFKTGKPDIRPAVYDDIRWVWVAARRDGFGGTSEAFTKAYEPILAKADRLFILEDRNHTHESGKGPVGLVMANYDGWALVPHVEWFPWATTRNKIRCTVGFLQLMKYTHDVGVIKIFSDGANTEWFKWLKRYISISLVGRIPGGRATGEECIFYIRGRKQHVTGQNIRRRQLIVGGSDISHPEAASSNA